MPEIRHPPGSGRTGRYTPRGTVGGTVGGASRRFELSEGAITAFLGQVAAGERGAEDRFAEAVVRRLEQIAAREMRRRNDGALDGFRAFHRTGH